MSDTLVAFEKADLGYGRRVVVRELDLALASGDYLGIVGQNGCGKTTILKAMMGVLRPLRGNVRRNTGVRFGYVPQRQYIDEAYPLATLEVALMGRYPMLRPLARPSRDDRRFAVECLEQAGIADLAERPYRELSGGQKQRTLIARALAVEPEVLILDEPTNDMDIGSEHAIMELLTRLHSEHAKTIVIVSHLLNVLVNYARDFAIVDSGSITIGRREDIVTPSILTDIYGVSVQVVEHGGRKVVYAGDCHV